MPLEKTDTGREVEESTHPICSKMHVDFAWEDRESLDLPATDYPTPIPILPYWKWLELLMEKRSSRSMSPLLISYTNLKARSVATYLRMLPFFLLFFFWPFQFFALLTCVSSFRFFIFIFIVWAWVGLVQQI